MELLTNIGAGIIGGLILNIMPCVLPVLAFKVQGWVHQADTSQSDRRKDALAFLAGTWVTFGLFAALVTALRASGQHLGWGMHMTNSGFVAFLVALLFVFGLNAVGVFQLNFSMGGSGAHKDSLWTSFSHGVLITLVSTPCSAPILGAATAAALAQDATWYDTLVLFWSIGLGLSLPVLAVGFVPAASRLIPRPGNWMNTFKYLVGFTLFGAAVWLYATLQKQVTPESANDFLWFIWCLTMVLWLKEKTSGLDVSRGRHWAHQGGLLGLAVLAGVVFVNIDPREAPGAAVAPVVVVSAEAQGPVPDEVPWVPFSGKVREAAMQRGQPVFVDFTADWCASCKVFEKTHIEVASIRQKLHETGILAAKADLTVDNKELWGLLNEIGRTGIPVYVIYLPDGSYDLLPEGPPLSLDARLDAAAKRFPRSQFKGG